jgi:hypothetical protein
MPARRTPAGELAVAQAHEACDPGVTGSSIGTARAHGFAGGAGRKGRVESTRRRQDDWSMTFEPADTPDTQPPDPVLGQPITSSVAGP